MSSSGGGRSSSGSGSSSASTSTCVRSASNLQYALTGIELPTQYLYLCIYKCYM